MRPRSNAVAKLDGTMHKTDLDQNAGSCITQCDTDDSAPQDGIAKLFTSCKIQYLGYLVYSHLLLEGSNHS